MYAHVQTEYYFEVPHKLQTLLIVLIWSLCWLWLYLYFLLNCLLWWTSTVGKSKSGYSMLVNVFTLCLVIRVTIKVLKLYIVSLSNNNVYTWLNCTSVLCICGKRLNLVSVYNVTMNRLQVEDKQTSSMFYTFNLTMRSNLVHGLLPLCAPLQVSPVMVKTANSENFTVHAVLTSVQWLLNIVFITDIILHNIVACFVVTYTTLCWVL